MFADFSNSDSYLFAIMIALIMLPALLFFFLNDDFFK